ncbi:hypothetical protein EVAR_103939_1 [Eumeta japonica]|uniref:Uncharacterized protein n=1 Tax=Eumeta variegata TaxID=151549 RepID=A0A4C1YCB1_EUMVA|nr:hypothetical protein EVAR_103939_1 [Eumeta japonica]
MDETRGQFPALELCRELIRRSFLVLQNGIDFIRNRSTRARWSGAEIPHLSSSLLIHVRRRHFLSGPAPPRRGVSQQSVE